MENNNEDSLPKWDEDAERLEGSLERGILEMVEQINVGISRRDDPLFILEKAFKALYKPFSYKKLSELFLPVFDEIEETYKTKNTLCGIPSGFSNLDAMTRGLQARDYVIVYGGSPEIRFFTLSMAANICVNQKIPAAYFSLELSDIFLAKSLISSVSGVMVSKLISGKLHQMIFAGFETLWIE